MEKNNLTHISIKSHKLVQINVYVCTHMYLDIVLLMGLQNLSEDKVNCLSLTAIHKFSMSIFEPCHVFDKNVTFWQVYVDIYLLSLYPRNAGQITH